MKNAIKILSIIYIPLIAIQILAYLICGISFFLAINDPNIYTNMNITPGQAAYIFTIYGTAFITVLVCLIPGLILNIILLKKSSSSTDFSKSIWITYGVLSLVLAPPSQAFLLSSMAQLKKSQHFILKKYIFKINKTIL